jgi:glycosyltransferase involved in cell wall biosynthesis
VLSVAFLANGSIRVPSARTRAYQLIPALRDEGIDARVLDPDALRHRLGFTRLYRLAALRTARAADVVVVQKQLLDRATLTSLTTVNPRLAYDFDDALYAPHDRHETSAVALRRFRRLDLVLGRARLVIAGNDELAAYAKPRAVRVAVVPTVVDADLYARAIRPRRRDGAVVVGWTGTAANLVYLEPLRQVIRDIKESSSVPVEFRVVCSEPPHWPEVDVAFRHWHVDSAIDDLAAFDIGIAPLPDTPWTRGKCGFKLLEYMALGLPTIASPVGVMPSMIDHGRSGFLADGPEDWRLRLKQLIADAQLRARVGDAGRAEVVRRYSVCAAAPRLAALLRSVGEPVGGRAGGRGL